MRILYTMKTITLAAVLAVLMVSCSKKTEEVNFEPLEEYTPLILQPGKYITYRVDSLVYTNFGRVEATRKYQVKHVVDAQITDNLGRPAYRVYRYINDTTASQSWAPNGSYLVTLLNDQVEVTEDNLRFIKLHSPLQANTNWKGNRYLSADPYGPLYNFSNDDAMEDWDYHVDGDKGPQTIGTQTIADIFTVQQADEAINAPVTIPTAYGAKTYSLEKYAQGIGLVYREHILWEYQPNPSGSGGPYKVGFGYKGWMIAHN